MSVRPRLMLPRKLDDGFAVRANDGHRRGVRWRFTPTMATVESGQKSESGALGSPEGTMSRGLVLSPRRAERLDMASPCFSAGQ